MIRKSKLRSVLACFSFSYGKISSVLQLDMCSKTPKAVEEQRWVKFKNLVRQTGVNKSPQSL